MEKKMKRDFSDRAIIDVTHSLAIFYGRKPVVVSTAAAVPEWATQPTFSFPVISEFVWIVCPAPFALIERHVTCTRALALTARAENVLGFSALVVYEAGTPSLLWVERISFETGAPT